MSSKSSIEWTDASWTPLRARVKVNAGEVAASNGYGSLVQVATKMQGHIGPHCEHVSPGCEKCYSETNNGRCLPTNGTGLPFDRRSRDLVDLFVDEKILAQPFHWRRARRIFVCSQTDLFAEFYTDKMIDRVFHVMAAAGNLGHCFQVLTKRSARMREYRQQFGSKGYLEHVWLGVSVEDRQRKDRIDMLRETPAGVRFLSMEPLLEDLGTLDLRGIDWVIVGGESGPGARPCNTEWIRSIVEQCKAAAVPCFVKQLGAHVIQGGKRRRKKDRKGGDMHEWEHDLRVKEMPQRMHAGVPNA